MLIWSLGKLKKMMEETVKVPFDRKRIHCTANFMLEFRYLKYRENGEIETPIQLRLTSKTYCLPIARNVQYINYIQQL